LKEPTADELQKAAQLMDYAQRALAADLHEIAAREAYLAAFHAALAYLFERRNAHPKTHSGVHSLFAETAAQDPDLGPQAGSFLPKSYDWKQKHDYSLSGSISEADAEAVVDGAGDFIARIERALDRADGD
jgi:uncharacterized protein (UPF0332 family)